MSDIVSTVMEFYAFFAAQAIAQRGYILHGWEAKAVIDSRRRRARSHKSNERPYWVNIELRSADVYGETRRRSGRSKPPLTVSTHFPSLDCYAGANIDQCLQMWQGQRLERSLQIPRALNFKTSSLHAWCLIRQCSTRTQRNVLHVINISSSIVR